MSLQIRISSVALQSAAILVANLPSRQMAHFYLYVLCKTHRCPAHLLLRHFESAEPPSLPPDYPDPALHLSLQCPACGQTHSYAPEDLRRKSSATPLHPSGWRPILPPPPRKPPDKG